MRKPELRSAVMIPLQPRSDPSETGRSTDIHLMRKLRLPIALVLLLTSLPAGLAIPSAVAGGYLAIRAAQPQPRYRKLDKVDHRPPLPWLAGVIAVGLATVAAHATLCVLAWRRWNGICLGFRGSGWFVLLWSAFAVGFVPLAAYLVLVPSRQW